MKPNLLRRIKDQIEVLEDLLDDEVSLMGEYIINDTISLLEELEDLLR